MQYPNKPVTSEIRPRRETLEYIQSMLEQLSRMAEFERATTLTYYMHMAYLECSDILRGTVAANGQGIASEGTGGAIARQA